MLWSLTEPEALRRTGRHAERVVGDPELGISPEVADSLSPNRGEIAVARSHYRSSAEVGASRFTRPRS